jgi:hypothetical protein
MQAFHWLSRNNVPSFIMDFDGSIISSILSPSSVKADLRAAGIQAASDPKKFKISHSLIEAKITRSLRVLDWLAQRYDIEKEVRLTRREVTRLPRASTVAQIQQDST